jgi:Ca-activated chloride channel family protein
MRSPARPLAVLLISLVASLAAHAADAITPGALSVTGKGGELIDLPLKHTKVSIEVTAFVARTTVEQVFANPFDEPVEAVYTFPLGDRAAVDDFELTVGERTIRGEIKRREEARRAYDAARAAGYQAALLEQERPNIFTQSVANLEPGKKITVRLRCVETLRYERGTYRLAFPLVVGPRYVPGDPARVPDAARIVSPPLTPGTRSGHDVEIDVTIDAGVPLRNLRSASHRIVMDRAGGVASAHVRLADDDVIPNKDFQLSWNVGSERPAVGLLAHRDGLDGFFTLLVQPKGEITATEAMPKEITLVVDTSGSMMGLPIQASQRFIAKALHELGPRDTFNIIRFSGDNEVFSKEPLPNVPAEIERAIAWVNGRTAGGGTEMLAALRAAFARPTDPNRLRVVIFFTDGYVGDDQEILREIGAVLGEARIDTVGIGSSVNRYLLDRMADLGRGAFVTIRPDESADDALEAFRSWVTRPYLTDLTVDWGALPIADVSPEPLRDLGSGQTLTLVGRYLSGAEGDVVVRGKLGGRYWEQTVHVALPDEETKHAPLASLWARGRIEELLRVSPGMAPDGVRAEVVALALEYRLMSPFTSFVAVDDSRVVNAGGVSRTIHQALPVPDGVSFEGIFGKDGPAALRDKESAGQDAPDEISGVVGGVVGGVGRGDSDGDGNPNVNGARERDFRTQVGGIASVDSVSLVAAAEVKSKPAAAAAPPPGRFYQSTLQLAPSVAKLAGNQAPAEEGAADHSRLREAAFRVLADLADDGKLSPAEGKPALAALLAAQAKIGAIANDIATHAIATWALAAAAKAVPTEPWIAAARTRALDYLVTMKTSGDAEATRWARLVLSRLKPAALAGVPVPQGEGSKDYVRLRDAIAASKSGTKAPRAAGHGPFDRLVATIGRGKLTI